MSRVLKDLVEGYLALKLKINFAVKDGWLFKCQLTSVKGFSVERRNSTRFKIKCSHLFRSLKFVHI